MLNGEGAESFCIFLMISVVLKIPVTIIIFCLVGGHFSSLMIQLKVNSFCAMATIGEAPTTNDGLHLVSVGNSLWAQQEIGTQEY